MPDTLFCKDGMFDFILTNDKDWCMAIDSKTKLSAMKIRVKFYDVVRGRKRDCTNLGLSEEIEWTLRPELQDSVKVSLFS